MSALVIYKYYSNMNSLIKQINFTNAMRNETKELLARNLAVKKQKEKVDEVLDSDKNFRIMHYFDDLTKQLRISQYVKEDKQINIESKQDYNEIALTAKINNINMKQLVDLLQSIENKEIVFTKKLDITKSEKLPVIDVDIVIATLQAKTE